jgi:hypothetical protein
MVAAAPEAEAEAEVDTPAASYGIRQLQKREAKAEPEAVFDYTYDYTYDYDDSVEPAFSSDTYDNYGSPTPYYSSSAPAQQKVSSVSFFFACKTV